MEGEHNSSGGPSKNRLAHSNQSPAAEMPDDTNAGTLPPLFKALLDLARSPEDPSWHTPGHVGGNAFLKSPIGRQFRDFFGEALLRSDHSVSVGHLGSLLDHTGPIGESERYLAQIFGAHRSYHVTGGSSTSNRIILGASVGRGQIVLIDRNCHKSVEHAISLSGAIPVYLPPSRNHYGLIGPIRPADMEPGAVLRAVSQSPLRAKAVDAKPVHAVITNSTYDGLIYSVRRIEELLGGSVDRLHFDEAWFGYARFHPLYKERFAMHGDLAAHTADRPTIFAAQSTHKLLAALSQSSVIHVRDGRNPVDHDRFNQTFMRHATTSPLYPILTSNEVSASIMGGRLGRTLLHDSMGEAVAFRQAIARLHADFAAKGQWFFNCWQPDQVRINGKIMPFAQAPVDELRTCPEHWTLAPGAAWHGFEGFPPDYAMLDPIKVSVVTPGIGADGRPEKRGIPAPLVTAYMKARGIIPEKTENFTILFLFSLGVVKDKWRTLERALLDFKQDYDADAPLKRTLPELAYGHPAYAEMGLRGLADRMFRTMADLRLTDLLRDASTLLPRQAMTPADAYDHVVRGDVVTRTLDEISASSGDWVAATDVVPYPPGIPLLMPGEKIHQAGGGISAPSVALQYLKGLETFSRLFPSFGREPHGVVNMDGQYALMCLKE